MDETPKQFNERDKDPWANLFPPGFTSRTVDLSATGSPDDVDALAWLLTFISGTSIVASELIRPGNVSEGRVKLKATLVLSNNLVQRLKKLSGEK